MVEDTTLKTQRLTLKPVAESDLQTLFSIFTNESVRQYLFDNEILPEAQIIDFIKVSENTFREKSYGLWLISLNETGERIGFTGLWHFFDENQPQLLYGLLPEFSGKGFATEAANEVVKYYFSNLPFDYLEASCDLPNEASHKVAERLGMKKVKKEIINDLPTVFFRLESK